MPYPTNGTIDLQAVYGCNWQRDNTLKNLGYTYQQAKDKFPAFVGYCEYKAWSQAEVLGLYEFEAAWNDAFWRTWGYFSETVPNYADIRSRGSIIAPDGGFRVKYGCLFGYGRYIGKGSNIYYVAAGNPNPGSTAGTGLYVDHANWMTARAIERMPMRSCSWGLNTGNAYMQGTVIEGFYLDGGCETKSRDASFKSYGIGLWDAGEASTVRNCYANGFNDMGYYSAKGTPAYFEACSAFSNCYAGIGIMGNNGLSTTTLTDFSGDDNKYLVLVEAMPGETSGGTLMINGLKHENGKRAPYRQQQFLKASGALNVVINGVSCDTQNDSAADTAFDVDFQTFPGQVEVHGVRLNGYKNALKLSAKGSVITTVPSPGNIVPFTIEMNETGVYRNTRASSGPTTPTDPTTPPAGSNIDRTGWKASGTVQTTAKPASLAVDGSTSTFCETGRPHVVGDYIEIDMQTTRSIGGVTILYQPYGNAWPNKVELFTSLTGAANSWTSRGVFQGSATCTMTLPAKVNCRYFKAVTKELIPNVGGPWCAISDVSAKG